MEKRLFIAVLISIGFLLLWSAAAPRLFPELARPRPSRPAAESPSIPERPEIDPIPPTPLGEETAPEELPVTGTVPAPSTIPVAAEREIETVIDHPRFVAVFTNRGAQLASFKLKNYRRLHGDGLVDLVRSRDGLAFDRSFAIQASDRDFTHDANHALYRVRDRTEGATRRVTFEYRDAKGRGVTKEFAFSEEMLFTFRVGIEGLDTAYRVVVGPGIGEFDPEAEENRFLITGNGIVQTDGSLDVIAREKTSQLRLFPALDFIGIADNYFMMALRPDRAGEGVIVPIEIPLGEERDPRRDLYAGLNAARGVVGGEAYFGPKEATLLERYGFEKALQLGVFGFIARFLLAALTWINTMTHNYGWSIIVLTILIKIVLYPLQHKSIVSMKKMQRVQPKVNAIRDRYKKVKTDPEQRNKMNQEMMKLYQQEKINPMSGCLPILLQLPILWAFYTLLSHAIELRGEPFILWITDLSAKDPYYITPILMTATMFIQQWMTPTTADPVQKRIFLFMPIVFGWIFKEFPSGLVLYWLVQNLLTILQQFIMNRWWETHPEELAKGTAK